MRPSHRAPHEPIEKWTDRSGVRIRYLDSAPDRNARANSALLPLLFSPGLTDTADEYDELIEFFLPRRVLVVEVRGRGRSDAPPTGYAVADHLADLRAVVEDEQLDRFHLMTFSRGSSWGLELALTEPQRIASLSIGDYQAVEVAMNDDFAGTMMATRFRGKPLAARVSAHVLVELQRASRPRQLWDRLGTIDAPLLVARGSQGGLVDDAAAGRYVQAVPDIEIVTIPGAGHDLFRPDRLAFPRAVADFIARRLPGM
jgi:non-heme chloroperoxidase